ncbi:MAG: efflux RND transporter periplasmic adaptor subunit [Alphaproteobacteria bacterium]|nr:efflux RND transporter periplasmic adaptor subunit [Alphaproteobacteria bacterium]
MVNEAANAAIAFSARLMLAVMFGAVAGAAAAQETHTVTARSIQDRKAVFATVESRDVAVARARIGGIIRGLAIDEGSAVKAQARLALVRDEKLQLRIAAVDAKIRASKAQGSLATLELARIRRLRRTGAATQARLDEAETRVNVVQSELAALQAERAVLVQEQADGNVLAPSAGRVLKVHVSEGTVVLPGDKIATITVNAYLLRMMLPERHARFIKTGDVVLVGPRGMAVGAQKRREGRVKQVYPELDKGRVVADVEVSGLGDFFVGERVRVYVATGSRRVLVIPSGYIERRAGIAFVRLKSGGEIVVQLGLPAEGGVEVLSGLKAGDVIVKP